MGIGRHKASAERDREIAGDRARALFADRRGATIIEFAIVAAPFLALIFAVIQTSLVFFSQQTLETATEDTARLILTNQAQGSMSQSAFKTAACSQLPSFMDCDKLIVDVRTADDFAGVDTTIPTLTYDSDGNVTNAWQFDMGGADKVVVMRLMYQLPVISAPLGFDMSNMRGSRRLLVATSVFQPEPTA